MRAGQFKSGYKPHNKGKSSPHIESARMVKGLSGMNGFAAGLKGLDIPTLIAGQEDLEHWAKTARAIARSLNQFATKLKKGIENAAAERAKHEGDQSQSGELGGPPDCTASPASGAPGAPGEETRP